MEQEVFETRKLTFTLPSGHLVTIREQNGADDDVLSNMADAASLMNLSRFIAGIVVDTDYTQNRHLTAEEVHNLPSLDRYAILFNSRIFSLGETIEFTHNWGAQEGGEVNYEQDLREFIFDYSRVPTEAEMASKPHAIPFYPEGDKVKDIQFTISSGKELMFDLLTAKGEAYVANLPLEKQTRNQVYVARNLRLKVGEKWDKVTNFSMFSVKDMIEVRNNIVSIDPIFSGLTEIENPVTGQKLEINILSVGNFFYPGEI